MALPDVCWGRALPRRFYREDSPVLAPLLLNKLLVSGDRVGRIVEVEAYAGEMDPASHAYRGRTPRNATMFGPPGHLYVYFTYGMHFCSNVVCGEEGEARAVLLRGLTPLGGLDEMRVARARARRDADLCSGPGKLTQALGIGREHDGADLVSGDRGVSVVDDGVPPPAEPGVSTRIGLNAGEGDDVLWRFYVRRPRPVPAGLAVPPDPLKSRPDSADPLVVAPLARRRPQPLGAQFESILAAAQCGAPWALERLYQTLAPAVAGYLRVQGSAEPEDLTSEVFFSVLSRIDSFRGNESQFRSWVFTIAHNRLVDERRARVRRPLAVEQTDAGLAADRTGGDAEDEALRRLSTDRVRTLCERLVPDQRDVLLLRMVGGFSLEQTAEALDKTEGAVKALQHRAVAALRRLLEREGVSL